jgi:hypothetical protein
MRDPCRLVPLPAKRHRSEIRRIGFDEKSVLGNQPEERVVNPFLESHDPAERHVPAGIESEFREIMCSSVTMENAADADGASVTDDCAGIIFGVSRVHNHRPSGFSCKRDLRGERDSLRVSRGVVVMVVETAFADCDSASTEQVAELRDVTAGIKCRGIVRMNSGGGEDESGIFSRARGGDRRGIDRLTDADDRLGARLAGARDYLAAVAGERRVREVGVAVDEDCRALVWRGHLRSIQSSTGAAT